VLVLVLLLEIGEIEIENEDEPLSFCILPSSFFLAARLQVRVNGLPLLPTVTH
jgi:hypothetical protein